MQCIIAAASTAKYQMVNLEPSVSSRGTIRLAFAMPAGVTVPVQEVSLRIGKPVVDPFLVQRLMLEYLGIFARMRIEGCRLQDQPGDGQNRRDEGDLLLLRLDFADHGRRASVFPGRVFPLGPTCLSIPGFSVATISALFRASFHLLGDIVFGSPAGPDRRHLRCPS